MTFLTFYELMDGFEDDRIDLAPGPADPARVAALTLARLGRRTGGRRRILRTALLAAALTLALSASVWAVYQIRAGDYVIAPDPAGTADASPAPSPRRQTMSLTGYQGTPEYEAHREWEEYLAAHYVDVGNDPSQYETPEEYWLYDAYTKEQADALDALMARYGLTRLTDLRTFDTPEQLYAFLGTEPFLPDALTDETHVCGGYAYDDGSFKLDMAPLEDGGLGGSMYVSVKGSFAMIQGALDTAYEEWEHTTASGQTVDIVRCAYGSYILMEAPGAYIQLRVNSGSAAEYDEAKDPVLDKDAFIAERKKLAEQLGMEGWTDEDYEREWEAIREMTLRVAGDDPPQAITRAELEALADRVRFDALAARFDGSVSREQTQAAFAVWSAQVQAAEDERVQAQEQRLADRQATVLAAIGNYELTGLPEGYYEAESLGCFLPEDGGEFYSAWRYYYFDGDETQPAASVSLGWMDDPVLADTWVEAGAAGGDIGPEVERVAVNGWEGRFGHWQMNGADYNELRWYDAGRGVQFLLCYGSLDRDELIRLAGTVAERTE